MVDNELAANYLYLISNKTETEDKISFVTSFPLLYQYYVEHRPYNLNLNLSLVLISENTLTVSQETLLQTASSVHENVLKRYMFLNPD